MNRDDYLRSVSEILKTNVPDSGPPITAARIGELIQTSIDGIRYDDVGFPSLKALLEEFEARGEIRLTRTKKNALAVLPHTPKQVALFPRRSGAFRRIRPLRRRAWGAFATPYPRGRRFLDQTTGEIRMGLENGPEGAADEWVEIEPVDETVQHKLAQQFLDDRETLSGIKFSDVEDKNWYRQFVSDLEKTDARMLAEWNRTRSVFVGEEAQKWCDAHKIDHSLVFQPPDKKDAGQRERLREISTIDHMDEQAVRDLILTAVGQLSTDELLDLQLKVKHILAAIFEEG